MSRTLASIALIVFLLCLVAAAQERSVTGEYRNNAEGFAVRVPDGTHGVAGNAAGPERGVKIMLPAGASVTVYGEPNSLEYKNPTVGVRDSLSRYHCQSGDAELVATRVGSLHGAKGKLVCGDQVFVEMLAFRPGGGPIYWLRLETTQAHVTQDEAVLKTIAQTFRIITWR